MYIKYLNELNNFSKMSCHIDLHCKCIILCTHFLFVTKWACKKALHLYIVKLISNVSMIRWPVGDKLAEPPTYQRYLFCFSLSLAQSSKDNEESQEGSVRSAAWKNERLLGPCEQKQENTEATDVLWAPTTQSLTPCSSLSYCVTLILLLLLLFES